MLKDGDINLTCRQCGKEFVFTTAEQEFYEQKGFALPSHCRECRSTKRNQPHRIVCAQCEVELEEGASIYCAACLERVQLQHELRIKQAQKATRVAHAKLLASESQKTELEESLCQKEQQIAELEQQHDTLSQDLEKAFQFHAALGWLEPTLKDMEARMEALERSQNKINERMLQLVERVHEMYENTSLLGIIKRSLKPSQGQDTQSKTVDR